MIIKRGRENREMFDRYRNYNGIIAWKNPKINMWEDLFICRTGKDGSKAYNHLIYLNNEVSQLKWDYEELRRQYVELQSKYEKLKNDTMNTTKLTVKTDETDPYALKISGQIQPIIARDKYDFTPLVDSLIEQGFTRDQAREMVLELLHEIVDELNKEHEEE